MRALQGHPGQDVSSTVTKRNPRPRKYASASERQAAYRARAPEVCFRAEGKTVDTLDKIAADLDVSRADLLLSMTKFALTNHDWGRFGLTHRPLPYQYGIEQEARTNPAPIWDRPRPKKLGPSVPLTAAQKRKAKALAAAAGRSYPNLVDNIAASRNPSMKQPTPAQIAARERFAEMARSGAFKRKAKKAKANPRKKTVSQKISQLVHEGYPQKQAVAVALSEQRKGKVKRNPAPMIRVGDYVRSYDFPGMRDDHYLEGVVTELRPHTYVIEVTRRVVEGVEKRIPASLKQVEAPRGKGMFSNAYGVQKIAQRNPATGGKGSRTKLNPVKKPRMLNISWLTAGGQREVMSVPIEFTFTEYVGNVAEKFFARLENGMLIVSEYATGGKVGQVPYRMREASLNDRDAAKRFTREMIERVGPEKFRAAIRRFEAIN